eukprot:1156090-Pelagomonas_calceolata.AAC.3
MAGIAIKHQPLGLFTPFLLQCYSLVTRFLNHQTAPNLVQWVFRCGVLVVKTRVHATANLACAPQPAVYKP